MKLFEHQESGIKFLKEKRKAILADEMGLGKTKQAIIAAGHNSLALVVCPASLKINWMREIKAVYPDNTVQIMDSKWEPTAKDPIGWYIVNYDILTKKMDCINEIIRNGVDVLILDEAHYIKGKSQRSSAIVGGSTKTAAGGYKKFTGIASRLNRVFCLTGTPLLNRPIEMFNLLKAVDHPLGSNRDAFAKHYCNAFTMVQIMNLETGKKFFIEQKKAYTYYSDRTKYKHMFRFLDESGVTAANLPELHRSLKEVMLRRKKIDVLDLPEKMVSIMECDMTDDWKKAYDTAWVNYIEWLYANPDPERDMDNIITARHLVELTKLKQVCSQSKVERIAGDALNAVEQGEKVIIFSQYTETINLLKDILKEGTKVVTLTGADDMNERQKAVDAFQNEDTTMVLIANIKAGGVGITLTKASIVMFADLEWSPEIHSQAEDRAHRIGQTGTVNVYYYVQTDTMEVDIMETLNEKKGTMDAILEGDSKGKKTKTAQQMFLEKLARRVTHSEA